MEMMTESENIEKVAIITGGNKGIGFEIVKNLGKAFEGEEEEGVNYVVYLTARNTNLGKEAVKEIENQGIKCVKFHSLDISSSESIEEFKNFIQENHGGLDVLVNNAGIAFSNNSPEPFHIQAEETNKINFFGTANLISALFPLFRKHSRIVNVSSILGHLSLINGNEPEADKLRKKIASDELEELELQYLIYDFVQSAKEGNHLEKGWPNSAYTVSKVGLSALTRVYQRMVDKERPFDDIIFNSVEPGYVQTDMTKGKGTHTVEEGAEAPIYLALLPHFSSIKGAFVNHKKAEIDWINKPIKW